MRLVGQNLNILTDFNKFVFQVIVVMFQMNDGLLRAVVDDNWLLMLFLCVFQVWCSSCSTRPMVWTA